jgi:pilus assembly protein CpaE
MEQAVKIAVISPNAAHLQTIEPYLLKTDRSRTISLHEGGATKVPVVADQKRPDLIILDSMCRDLEDLRVLEHVGARHPQSVVVMLCANQTPEFLINAMRAGVREVLQSPVTREALAACVERVEQRLGLGGEWRQPGQILAFVPCKGGSGSTFIATNLAFQMATENKKIILIDLNLQFGDAVLFVHDHRPPHNLADVVHNIQRLDASFPAGSLINVLPNYGVLAAPEDPGHAMEIKPEHVEALLNVAANNYDYVILDLGRTLDAVTIRALDQAHQIFPVIQMTLPFIRDASRLFSAFRSLSYSKEKIRLLINRYDRRGEISLQDVTRTLGIEPFKTLPNSYEAVAAAVNQGQPIASFARNNPMTKSLEELAQQLTRRSEESNAFLGRLLRRSSSV